MASKAAGRVSQKGMLLPALVQSRAFSPDSGVVQRASGTLLEERRNLLRAAALACPFLCDSSWLPRRRPYRRRELRLLLLARQMHVGVLGCVTQYRRVTDACSDQVTPDDLSDDVG